ncbi:cellobiose 2-epimerase [Komagataeibacter europaeus]|uniref:Cellobiose 2-epimerase n=1 Tax=Komagataeibacter europaeus TaxID=33995 RepID=A0A0M0EG71_KOMEU|nr:cellobiose 2-epimerase [Komagataeibacter europaeus]
MREIFHAQNGGFLDAAPPYDAVRRQNPHMHLLEAYLALFEATGNEVYRNFASELVELGIGRFIEPNTSLLLEDFDSNWKPLEPFGHNRAEPGHLFEWSWLLQEYLRLYADAKEADKIHGVAKALHQTALVHTNGTVPAVIRNGVAESGAVINADTRIWPQTEFMRSLALTVPKQKLETDILLASVLGNFSTCYIPASLHGGWIDRLSADGKSVMDHMPASSLYHIYGAVCELSS